MTKAKDKYTILVSVGTRPEAVKLAPVIHALGQQPWARVRVLATAQHRELLDQIFAFFGIVPDVDLNLMHPNQSLADLTSRMITELTAVLVAEKPDFVIAQGDTTTVMVTGLCCYYQKIPFGHVEAGLRTGEKYFPFPEEMNRALVGSLADLHFAPTNGSRDNLLREGVPESAVSVTGNTVIDALIWAAKQELPPPPPIAPGKRLILVTAHRRENFGAPLEEICKALVELVKTRDVEILYPVHPNPQVQAAVAKHLAGQAGIHLVAPLDYPNFVAAMQASYFLLTDSGGVQEEAPSLGKPVLVMRDQTERPEGVTAGTAYLVGPHRERILAKSYSLLDNEEEYKKMAAIRNPYGDGLAAERIVKALRDFF